MFKRFAAIATVAVLFLVLVPAIAFAGNLTSASTEKGDGKALMSGTSRGKASASKQKQKKTPVKKVKTVNVYCLYNTLSREYLYTTNRAERKAIMKGDWVDYGVAWKAPAKSSKPVYRHLNKRTGMHRFSRQAKISKQAKKNGWINEGPCWYLDDDKSVNVYRLFNPASKVRAFYTTSAKIKNLCIANGWKCEKSCWYAAARGMAKRPTFKQRHWTNLLSSALSGWNATATHGFVSARKLAAVDRRTIGYADCGYIALNMKTGKVVARNADMCIFGASTIKAPYIAALCKDDAPDIGSWGSWMYDIITYSDNYKYNSLFAEYGTYHLDRLADQAGVYLDYRNYTTCYADYSPRDLAKLWAVIAGYLNSDSVNVDFFKSLFGQGEYYKEGWMEVYSWCGPMYHVGGTTGDCVYAIMTTTTRPNDDVWSLRDALVRAVS